MIVGQEIQQTQNSIKTTKNNQVWYIKRNYAQLYLDVSVKVSVIFKSGDGRTRTAVFYRSSPFNKVFIFNTLSLFEYNAIYLYISKSVCKFVCTF